MTCKVSECSRPKAYAEMCAAHQRQMDRTGRTWKIRTTKTRAAQGRFEDCYTPEPNTGCWLWTGLVNKNTGRAFFYWEGRTRSAARFALRADGRDPGSRQANHTCHNKMCVNPKHLYVGTQKDNIRDMINAGRAAWQTK